MRPVLQDNKINKKLWVIYIAIFLLCVIGIGVAMYLQFFKDEKIGVAIGITNNQEDDEYNELKKEFEDTLLNNTLDIFQNEEIEVTKIHDEFDMVVTAYTYTKINDEYGELNAAIPYINIKKENALKFNTKMRDTYKKQAQIYETQVDTEKIKYNVRYKAYVNDNILSIIVMADTKEGTKSQKTTIETFNYDLINDKELKISDILDRKNITEKFADDKIKKEIQEIQERNKELLEQGFPYYQRDYTLDMYKILNSNQYFLGKDKMLYIVYAYGNIADTNEMDVVIFK